MLFLNPSEVTLLGAPLRDVRSLAVDRVAARAVTEWSDAGPHAVFADVPEQRVTIVISRDVAADEPAGVRPGDQGAIQFRAGAGLDEAGVRSYSATVVALRVAHRLSRTGGAAQEIELLALSPTGAADPIVESEVTP